MLISTKPTSPMSFFFHQKKRNLGNYKTISQKYSGVKMREPKNQMLGTMVPPLCSKVVITVYRSNSNLNSGVTAGGRGPQTLPTTKFLLTYREKKRELKKGKSVVKKRRKIETGKVENWKWKYEKFKKCEEDYVLPGKSISRRGKSRKNDFAPSEKISSSQYALDL